MTTEKPLVQRLLFWDEEKPTLNTLAALSSDQLAVVAEFVEQKGFSSDFHDTLDLAQRLGISHEGTLDVLRYVGFLDNQRQQFSLSTDDIIDEFQLYAQRRSPGELETRLREREPLLRRLFSAHPVSELRAKIQEVSTAIVPMGVSFTSLCDLRPVFNDERDKIVEYAVAALIRIDTRSSGGEDSNLIFQLDLMGLESLEAAVAQLRKKWSAISSLRDQLLGGSR